MCPILLPSPRRSYLILRIAVKQLTTGGAGAGLRRNILAADGAACVVLRCKVSRTCFLKAPPGRRKADQPHTLLPAHPTAEDIREVEEREAAKRQQQQARTPKDKRVASVGSMPTPD